DIAAWACASHGCGGAVSGGEHREGASIPPRIAEGLAGQLVCWSAGQNRQDACTRSGDFHSYSGQPTSGPVGQRPLLSSVPCCHTLILANSATAVATVGK